MTGLSDSDILAAIEEKIKEMANAQASMAWSTPGDALKKELGEDALVIAHFGDRFAKNGHPLEPREAFSIVRDDYRFVREGRVPPTEEEVSLDSAIEHAHKELQKKHGNFPISEVERVERQKWGRSQCAYRSVSGTTFIYARRRSG